MAKGRSRLGDKHVRKDHFHAKAKDQGFRARKPKTAGRMQRTGGPCGSRGAKAQVD